MSIYDEYAEFMETGVVDMKPISNEDKLSKVKALQVEIQELLGRVYGNQKAIIKLLDEVNKPTTTNKVNTTKRKEI